MRNIIVRDVWVTRGLFQAAEGEPFEVVEYERFTKTRFLNAVRRREGDNLIILKFSCEKEKRQMSLAKFYNNSEPVNEAAE